MYLPRIRSVATLAWRLIGAVLLLSHVVHAQPTPTLLIRDDIPRRIIFYDDGTNRDLETPIDPAILTLTPTNATFRIAPDAGTFQLSWTEPPRTIRSNESFAFQIDVRRNGPDSLTTTPMQFGAPQASLTYGWAYATNSVFNSPEIGVGYSSVQCPGDPEANTNKSCFQATTPELLGFSGTSSQGQISAAFITNNTPGLLSEVAVRISADGLGASNNISATILLWWNYSARTVTAGLSSPTVRPGGSLHIYAAFFDSDGKRQTNINRKVEAVLDGNTNNLVTLRDNTAELPPGKTNDAVHSGWFRVPTNTPAGSHHIQIRADGNTNQMPVLPFAVSASTPLLILTDLQRLANEFAASGTSAFEDTDRNEIPDFYDLLRYLHDTAQSEAGMLVSIDHEIPGFDATNSAAGQDRGFQIPPLIREYLASSFPVTPAAGARPLGAIAIVGNDAVIPFYRFPTPALWAVNHKAGFPKGSTPPTLRDAVQGTGYEITDVPYADAPGASATSWNPNPRAAIARAFNGSPSSLIRSLQSLRQPLLLDPARSATAAFVFQDEIGHNIATKRILPVLRRAYTNQVTVIPAATPTPQPNALYEFPGFRDSKWGADQVF